MATALSLCAASVALTTAAPLKKELNEGWKFRQARTDIWHPATVPGVVHTDLIDNHIIEDPFFRLNERGVQWVDKEDWVYQTSFSLTSDMMERQFVDLVFEGIDTYADVYLNEQLVLSADNMFRRWRVSAKEHLKEGENTLKVYFHSPVKVDVPKWDALPFHYEASNDQSENGGLFDKKISVFARKAGYHYGWDWGPRLVTSGIWRPVYLEAWDEARISDLYIRQQEVNARNATLSGEVEVEAGMEEGAACIVLTDAGSNRVLTSLDVSLQRGTNRFSLPFTLRNPRLWWSNGLGEQHRYDFRVTLLRDGKEVDTCHKLTGIRSLKLIRKPDADGHTFYFELNGVPVFAKGANYIPQDNFLPRVTPAQYEKTLRDAVDVHMNMLRIWGGGIYENDLFYDLCDRYGILIWQDFMFACSVYPAEGALLENIRQEAIDNVRRLRNHACIALWCGNNECNDAWYGWGWEAAHKKENPADAELIRRQQEELYFHVLADVVKEHAPESFYWPSSPFAEPGRVSDDRNGDRHYWDVWHGQKPISDYNRERSRFFSEYGFQSFPDMASVRHYAPRPEDWDIRSEVMMAHQRGGSFANQLIETYLLNEYRKPLDFERFLYMNQVLQGDAIKTAIEAHRRDRPYCMGTLFWQHNDCWPVASWASRDYYGHWKAQHYFARKAFDDLLVSPIADEAGLLQVYVVSDRLTNCSGTLEVSVRELTGNEIGCYRQRVKVAAGSSRSLFSIPVAEALKGVQPGKVFIHATLTTDGDQQCYTNNYFLVKQKEMEYPSAHLSTVVTPIEGGYQVAVSSDSFARAVHVTADDFHATYSDNYVDILPGETLTLNVFTDLPQPQFEKQLKVCSLRDAY